MTRPDEDLDAFILRAGGGGELQVQWKIGGVPHYFAASSLEEIRDNDVVSIEAANHKLELAPWPLPQQQSLEFDPGPSSPLVPEADALLERLQLKAAVEDAEPQHMRCSMASYVSSAFVVSAAAGDDEEAEAVVMEAAGCSYDRAAMAVAAVLEKASPLQAADEDERTMQEQVEAEGGVEAVMEAEEEAEEEANVEEIKEAEKAEEAGVVASGVDASTRSVESGVGSMQSGGGSMQSGCGGHNSGGSHSLAALRQERRLLEASLAAELDSE